MDKIILKNKKWYKIINQKKVIIGFKFKMNNYKIIPWTVYLLMKI